MADIQVVQVTDGEPVEYSGKRFAKKTIKVGRIWQVLYDGEVIGAILYTLITREQRTPGRRYVNSRWKSPGWQYTTDAEKAKNANSQYSSAFHRAGEAYSKKDAVENIVWNHERNIKNQES